MRIALALNSAVPDLGSVASMVRMLVDTWSGKCNVMKARPGRSDASKRTGTSTEPRRELARTLSPSKTPRLAPSAGEIRRAARVPNRLGARPAPVRPEAPGELADDLDVVARAGRRLEGSAHSLDAPLAVGHRAFRLGPACGRGQHDVGQLRGLREEYVLDDQVVETA